MSLIVLAALAGACSAVPDVVATDRAPSIDKDASPFDDLPLVRGCRPGQYQGQFSTDTDTDSSATGFQLIGNFTFSLEQTTSGEFLTLANDAALSGTASSALVTFSATILGGRSCVDGKFDTTMENGQFSVAGGSTPTPFKGTVSGRYDLDLKGFTGRWDITIADTTTTLGGYWSATLVHALKRP